VQQAKVTSFLKTGYYTQEDHNKLQTRTQTKFAYQCHHGRSVSHKVPPAATWLTWFNTAITEFNSATPGYRTASCNLHKQAAASLLLSLAGCDGAIDGAHQLCIDTASIPDAASGSRTLPSTVRAGFCTTTLAGVATQTKLFE
jgi:hypothetical protein